MLNVKPYEKNAKKHPPEQIELIAKSIARFGWQQPIKIGADGIIIVGHGRWSAWSEWGTKLGLKEPWIVDAEGKTISGEAETRVLTEDEERAYRLADNQINALSGNDHSLLLPELKELNFASPELFDLTGFDRKLILEDDAKSESVPGLPTEPRTKVGDIYRIGPHRVICGDSTVSSVYDNLFTLDGFSIGKADMVLTDPPYNVDYTGKTKDALKIENDHKSDEDFSKFLVDAFTNVDRVLKPGGGILHLARRQRGLQFQGSLPTRRVESAPVSYLEQERHGHGPSGLPLETRALPLRLERGFVSPLECRSYPNDRPRLRSAVTKRATPYYEACSIT